MCADCLFFLFPGKGDTQESTPTEEGCWEWEPHWRRAIKAENEMILILSSHVDVIQHTGAPKLSSDPSPQKRTSAEREACLQLLQKQTGPNPPFILPSTMGVVPFPFLAGQDHLPLHERKYYIPLPWFYTNNLLIKNPFLNGQKPSILPPGWLGSKFNYIYPRPHGNMASSLYFEIERRFNLERERVARAEKAKKAARLGPPHQVFHLSGLGILNPCKCNYMSTIILA